MVYYRNDPGETQTNVYCLIEKTSSKRPIGRASLEPALTLPSARCPEGMGLSLRPSDNDW
jgi:hypothetical protein